MASNKVKDVIGDDAKIKALCQPIFDEMDKDKSGVIDAKELEQALAKMAKNNGLPAPNKKEIDEIMKSYDKNKDGTIQFEEFVEVTRASFKKAAASADAKGSDGKVRVEDKNFELFVSQAFDVLDKDRSGTINSKELDQGLEKFGSLLQLPANKDKLNKILDKYDANKDRLIDFREFKQMAVDLFNIELPSGAIKPSIGASQTKIPEEAKVSEHDQHEAEKMAGDYSKLKEKNGEQYIQYIEETGLAMAFKIIFAEILSKKIPEDSAFAYTATRLRQIGDDIAYIQDSKYKKFISKK